MARRESSEIVVATRIAAIGAPATGVVGLALTRAPSARDEPSQEVAGARPTASPDATLRS